MESINSTKSSLFIDSLSINRDDLNSLRLPCKSFMQINNFDSLKSLGVKLHSSFSDCTPSLLTSDNS